jgi:Helix-turn-helix domain
MEAVVLSQKNFNVIQEDLQEIKAHVKNISSPSEHFIDNKAFTKMMGISSRTAQIWRDEGKIGYSQEGKKIYYRMSDVDKFLLDHHRKPFAKPSQVI